MLDVDGLKDRFQRASVIQKIAAVYHLGGGREALSTASYYAKKAGVWLPPLLFLTMIFRAGLFVLLRV